MPKPNYQKVNRNFVNQRGASSGANKVPSNIACNVCRVKKNQSQFAGRQLSKFSSYNKAFVRDPNSVKVTCKDCTARQTTDLTCCVCSSTKPLKDFAKSQRKTPDQARCMDCVNKDLETEPNIVPSSDESASPYLSEPDSDFDDWETPTPPTKFTSKKLSPSVAKPAANEESHPSLDDDFAALTVADRKENENEWHVAGNSRNSNAAVRNSDSSASATRPKKSGWAKAPKIPKAKATRWGEGAEENILDYSTTTTDGTSKGAFNNRLIELDSD
ncbi:hypothetical protein C7212DRAFT_314700 [Tuber magnatum]|uniref:Stc1 domain-containing protein n=1 Tax=Tuber magnatum TaxID=42249 RepID=A0A317ST83_9PEZI|nr:hypothetical protein C7212DRAFT_314700 [Tuber magnatum]